MTRSPFQKIDSLPYDQTVLILWSDGNISRDFWYDQDLSEWLSERKRKPFHDGDPAVVPTHWMPEPELPEDE